MKSGKMTLLVIAGFFSVLSACNSGTSSLAAVKETEAVLDKYYTGWYEEDGDMLSAMYADDFIGFDATAPGWSYGKEYADDMGQSASYWESVGSFTASFIVSADAGFAALVGTVTYTGKEEVPFASVIAVKDGQIHFTYDYYGGAMGGTEPLPAVEARTADPGLDEAKEAVNLSSAAVRKWRDAFNARNLESYLSCYAEELKYVDMASPGWRILTKSGLAAEAAYQFPRSEYQSGINASSQSPLTDGFFISADGHYAVAQGTYFDTSKAGTKPMFILLELSAGKIVKQYNYLIITQTALAH